MDGVRRPFVFLGSRRCDLLHSLSAEDRGTESKGVRDGGGEGGEG